MPKARHEQVQAVCRLLHSRGREVLPGQIRQWLTHLRNVSVQRGAGALDETRVLDDVLRGNSKATAMIHTYFGSPLEDDDKADISSEEQE